jgi:hypothetical protein
MSNDIIDLNKSDEIVINLDNNKEPINFGGGIELLMNDKIKSNKSDKSNKSNIMNDSTNLSDINSLEKELNDLTINDNFGSSGLKINNEVKLNDNNNINLNVNEVNLEEEIPLNTNSLFNISDNLANDLGNSLKNEKKDLFKSSLDDIVINPDKVVEPKKTQEDLLKEKFVLLRKLENLENKGIRLSKRYTIDSNLNEMKGEYELLKSEKEKSNSVKFQGKMLMAAITGIEFLNNRFDPFDIKLDGWSEQINENINDYDEIFSELHEKYKSKAKMAPELKLLFQLFGSGVMIHMTNTMFKSAIPGMDDIMKQNPELMQQFTKAAMNSMGESNPGFGNFMNDVVSPDYSNAPPPEPVKTRVERSEIKFNNYNVNNSSNDGISINNQYNNVNEDSRIETNNMENNTRPEMRGPSDISDILSGLKPKNVNIHNDKDNESTLSIKELKELSNAKIPSRSTKGKRKNKTSISLDI